MTYEKKQSMSFLEKIETLNKKNKISELSFYLCKYNLQLMKDPNKDINQVITLLCLALYQAEQLGHTALTIENICNRSQALLDDMQATEMSHYFKADSLLDFVSASAWVTSTAQLNQQFSSPLVICKVNNIICFQRQLDVHRSIQSRLAENLSQANNLTLKVSDHSSLDAGQMKACNHALAHSFSIICGAPGSGKTSSVFSIVYALLENNPRAKIALAASTGKAAARLTQSIQKKIIELSAQQRALFAHADLYAKTLHRLLAYSPKRQQFIHNEKNLLECDVLIIDEVSMLSAQLFNATLKALSPKTKLIFLGDKYQLQAIESGNILEGLENSSYKASISYLSKQYRFSEQSGIARLLAIIKGNKNDNELSALLSNTSDDSLVFIPLNIDQDPIAALQDSLIYQEITQQYLTEHEILIDPKISILEKLRRLSQFQVLSPFHDGYFGITSINHHVEKTLNSNIPRNENGHVFLGQRILIQENHYELGLFNGDMGVILFDDEAQQLKAYFINHVQNGLNQVEQQPRSIPILQLPAFVSAYAMSIHKAQGSEFDTVFLLIPPAISENQALTLQSRLIYTAVSRARLHLRLACDLNTLKHVLNTQQQKENLFSYLV